MVSTPTRLSPHSLIVQLLMRIIPALKPNEVTEALQLSKLKDKVWYVVPSCATTGEGLVEGLGWLSTNVKAPLPAPKK